MQKLALDMADRHTDSLQRRLGNRERVRERGRRGERLVEGFVHCGRQKPFNLLNYLALD